MIIQSLKEKMLEKRFSLRYQYKKNKNSPVNNE